VDLGLIEEVKAVENQFKHLLNYFAALPSIAIPCCLMGVEFKLNNYQMPAETYKALCDLCLGDSFFVQPYNQVGDIWNVKIVDIDQHCLNDIIIQRELGVYTIFRLLFINNTVVCLVFFIFGALNGNKLEKGIIKNNRSESEPPFE
jgi:hypothetical protein